MKRIVYVSFPFSSHINPQVNLCKKLAEKDVEQIYFTTEGLFYKFDGIENIILKKYPKSFEEKFNELAEKNRDTVIKQFRVFALMYYFYAFADELMQYIIDEIGDTKPTIIISDPFAIWGKMLAKYYKIPIVNFYIGMLGDALTANSFKLAMIRSLVLDVDKIFKLGALKSKIEKTYGAVTESPGLFLRHQGDFSIVPTSREFHIDGDKYGDNVKFMGPAHVENSEIPDKKDTIFIAMGTFSANSVIWDKCIEATKDLGYNVVISFGSSKANKISYKNIPDNVKIYDNLPINEYVEVLKRSALFISHGGFNSINDAILYETPLLICPDTSEQRGNGEMLESYGCGLLYPGKRYSANKIREKAQEILGNKKIQANLRKYRQSFINSMGYSGIVEELNKAFNLFED